MIALGSDHAGFALKEKMKAVIEELGLEFKDYGTYDENSVDYPVIAKSVCKAIKSGECEKGILICGTGVGMSIAANKVKGIRASLCGDAFSARFTRLHNDSNVLCMGARVIGEGIAAEIVKTYLTTDFEGGRHERRVNMVTELENEQ